jgi:PAS domain S-box-containing protein
MVEKSANRLPHPVSLDHTQDAVILRDLEDRILLWNKGAEHLYGWRADEAVGQNIYDLLFQGTAAENGKESPPRNGECFSELHQVTKDRRDIVVESRSRFLYDELGQPKSVLITNRDITEKKMLECQFLRGQRLESIGRLACGIAHDLNNILSPMLLAIHMLKQEHMDSDSQRWLERLQANTNQAGRLVTQLLAFARGDEDELVCISPSELIGEAVDFLRSAFPKSIEIKLGVAAGLWSISGNPTHLNQVIINLCINARDAMPEGGTLSIEAYNAIIASTDTIEPVQRKPGRYVVIQVTDTGAGISAEIMDKIFEPFFTTKDPDKGTGLGLSTVVRIIKSHRGFIDVASKLGHGAAFRVFLPAEEPRPAAEDMNGEASKVHLASYRMKGVTLKS